MGAIGAPGISGTGGMAGTLLASGALLGIADGHCTMCTSAARASDERPEAIWPLPLMCEPSSSSSCRAP